MKVVLNEGQTELVLRQGEAPKVYNPKAHNYSAQLDSVLQFIRMRIEHGVENVNLLEQGTACITINLTEKKVVVESNPNSELNTVLTATLEYSDILKTFGINQEKEFNKEQIVKLLRFNSRFFADADKHTKLLESFVNFSAKVNGDVTQNNDNRGNVSDIFNKTVKTNLPKSFVMNIPVTKYGKPQRVTVELFYDVDDRKATFWFESPELEGLIEGLFNAVVEQIEKEFGHTLVILKK